MNQEGILVVILGASRDQFPSDAERFEKIGLALLDLDDSANVGLEYRLADEMYDGPARCVIEIGDNANPETVAVVAEIVDDFGIADLMKRPLFDPGNCFVPGADPAGCGTLIAALLLIASATAALASVLH